ncbi:MAG: hypothetical protein HY700_10775 [Gemmatimonadetes bacterium]|nr:hypothetical protein [Gemmatimonadota bacterium]
MAADYTLLLAAHDGNAWLRLYSWNPACLSFGRNEPALQRYDRERIARLGLDAVRRPTGGRAVWHSAEVTYAVAAPADTFGSLSETYAAVHRLLANAVSRLGLAAGIAARPTAGHAGLGAGACFASPAGGEVVVDARKLIGSAQVRKAHAFLQHGSILLQDEQDVVSSITRGAAAAPLATSLSRALGRSISFEEVADVVAEEARSEWEGSWNESVCEPDPNLISRFADPAWTWKR